MIVVPTRKEHIKRAKVAKKKDQPVDLFWQKMRSKVPTSFSLTFSPFEISLLHSEEIPESSRFDRNNRKEDLIMPAKVDPAKCSGCGTCVPACPVEAIKMENDKANVDADTCIDCGACVSECPMEAISQE